MRDLTAIIAGVVLGFALSLSAGFERPRGVAEAQGFCEPSVALAGEAVTCVNLSSADRVTWDFGDGAPPVTVPATAGSIRHIYEASGEYTVGLIARRGGGDKPDRKEIAVTVQPVDALDKPIQLAMVGFADGDPLSLRTTHRINEAVRATDGTAPPVSEYRMEFEAADGFTVDNVALRVRGATGLTRFRNTVGEDGKTAIVSFGLKRPDGEAADRSYFLADVIIDQKGPPGVKRVQIFEPLTIDRYATYSLDWVDLAEINRLEAISQGGERYAAGAPDETMVSWDNLVMLRLRQGRTTLKLDVSRP